MRLEIVREVFLKELRETLRDRRSLLVMFGVPLLLYPLLTLATASLGTSTMRRMSERRAPVAVVNGEDAPGLVRRIERSRSGLRLAAPAAATDARLALAAGRVDAVLIVPPHFERDALAAAAAAAQDTRIRVQIDRSRTASTFTENKINRVLDGYERDIIRERLRARSLPPHLVRPLATVTENIAPPQRQTGTSLSYILPMLLLVTGMLGAFFPAVNATTSERELGTLETLLVTPARKLELLAGKSALVLLAGLLTAGINLLSMTLVFWRIASQSPGGALAFSLDPGTLGLVYLAVAPTILFFAAAVLVVGLFARNYREANSYLTPVMLLTFVPLFVSLTEPKTTPALLITPTVNTSIIIRDVLTGQATAGAFLLAFLSSSLYAGLMLSLAARLFRTEDLVNPAWEPLSLKGLGRRSKDAAPRARRLPAADEALMLFAVSLALVFYVSPSGAAWGVLPLVAVNELLLIAAPALFFAWLFRWRWVETFAWRKAGAREWLGAALMGVGLVPVVGAVVALQGRIWPPNPEFARAMANLFLPALQHNPLLTVVGVALLAGVCEEILYRGPIQTALARRLPPWLALGVGGFLFGAAHLYAEGLIPITLAGIMLGWVVLRGGSIFPAMLLHFVYDAVKLATFAYMIRTEGPERALQLATRPDTAISGSDVTYLIGGIVLLLLGLVLLQSAYRNRAATGRITSDER